MDLEDPFRGCWDRFDRAATHKNAAMALWSAFLQNQDHEAYEIALTIDPEGDDVGRGTLRCWPADDMPTAQLSILFGEYFYNLRAALDYAVYATAIIDNGWRDPPPDEHVLQFPVCETPASWRKNAYHVRPLSEKHQAWIESVQPYQGTDDPTERGIYWLNHLARLDRHRALRVVGGYIAESAPTVRVKPEAVVDFDEIERHTFVDSYNSAVIASFTISPWKVGDFVEANPNAALDIDLRDFALGRPRDKATWLRLPMSTRLFLIESVIHTEVGRLEYDCTKRTRAQFLDKDWIGFKSDELVRPVPKYSANEVPHLPE
jgi:hypothetical protein